jgi:hypothetical protein
MKQEFKDLEQRWNAKLNDLEQRWNVDIGDLRKEIEDVRKEIKNSEQRLNARWDVTEAENKAHRARLEGNMVLLKWMFGASMTAFVGILIRMLLYRTPI